MHIAMPYVATAVSPLLFRKLGYEIPFHSLAFLLVLLSCSLPCCLEILDLNGLYREENVDSVDGRLQCLL